MTPPVAAAIVGAMVCTVFLMLVCRRRAGGDGDGLAAADADDEARPITEALVGVMVEDL